MAALGRTIACCSNRTMTVYRQQMPPCPRCSTELASAHSREVFLDDGEFDQVLLADAAHDPTGGITSDSERMGRALDGIFSYRRSRYDVWGDERD